MWSLQKVSDHWEIWDGEEKWEERPLPFLKAAPHRFDSLEELEKWLGEEEARQAKNSAVWMLAARNQPSVVLQRKLRLKGFRDKIVREIVSWAEQKGYVADLEYVRSFVQHELERGYGPRAVSWKLAMKGFSQKAVDQEIAQIMTAAEQKKSIRRQAAKMQNSDKARLKLVRRGFSFDMINESLKFRGARKTGKRNDVADIFHACDEEDEPLEP